jgi:hypothetical protein
MHRFCITYAGYPISMLSRVRLELEIGAAYKRMGRL